MSPRIGELFAVYGGLGMAVREVYGGDVVWYSEFDDAPSRIMAHHHPGVPNYGDITTIDWSSVEPVDILTGGFPCQDVSVAGRRAGMRDGTRSGLWSYMRTAIDELRPELVVIENVGGLFSAEADRIVEPCDYHLGDADGGGHTVLLRAADAVLGDLATLGYDAEWTTVRASDVGAPHGRLRVFITAHPQDTGRSRGGWRPALALAGGAGRPDAPSLGADPGSDPSGDAPGLTLLPTPVASEAKGAGRTAHRQGGHLLSDAVLLPTPAAARAGRQRSASEGAAIRPTLDSIHQLLPTPGANLGANGGPQHPDKRRAGGHSVSIEDAVHGLIPTPSVADAMGGHERRGGARGGELLLKGMAKEGHLERFGPYAPVIARWEHVLGRPSPAPTEPGRTRPRLADRFVEWLMGLPDGHVTAVPDLTRNQRLKALGNGVVPQQGAAALRHLHAIRFATL